MQQNKLHSWAMHPSFYLQICCFCIFSNESSYVLIENIFFLCCCNKKEYSIKEMSTDWYPLMEPLETSCDY